MKLQNVLVLIPSYFDLDISNDLAKEISCLSTNEINFEIIIIDESLGQDVALVNSGKYRRHQNFFRMGSQSAIVTTLVGLRGELGSYDYVCTLDGDGEDAPSDILRLIEMCMRGSDIALATRGKRHSTFLFKFSRLAFQLVFLVLTGHSLNSGSFAVIKTDWLLNNLGRPEFAFSYSGAIAFLPANRELIKCDRAPRRKGKSKMRLTDSISDGLRLLLPFAPRIAARSFLFFLTMLLLAFLSGIWIAIANIFGFASPGWTTSALILVGVFVTSSLIISLVTLGIMSNVLLAGESWNRR